MLLIAIRVLPSPIEGLGVFAAEPVSAGTIVWQFDPGVDHRHPLSWLERQAAHVKQHFARYGVVSLDRLSIYLGGDQTIYINHSATPNLVPQDELLRNNEGVVVAARAIAAGEELTVNYGDIDGADRDKLARGLPLFGP
jgi:uncharacterized protein